MARLLWPLRHGRPCVEVVLTLAPSGQAISRLLLADTGAGSRTDNFQLILDEDDCLLCGGISLPSVTLGGAYVGSFPIYDIPVRLAALGFDRRLHAVGVPSVPAGLTGSPVSAFSAASPTATLAIQANLGWRADEVVEQIGSKFISPCSCSGAPASPQLPGSGERHARRRTSPLAAGRLRAWRPMTAFPRLASCAASQASLHPAE